ncbi:MAG: translation initiation factor IF-2 [Filifactoraceae bacterium]
MDTIRIYQLAKELKISNKELLQKLSEIGVKASNHMSTLTHEEAKIIKTLYARWKTKDEQKDKIEKKEELKVEKKDKISGEEKSEDQINKPAIKKEENDNLNVKSDNNQSSDKKTFEKNYNQEKTQGSYNNNRPQGDRPQGSYNNNRPQGDRPQGSYNNNRPQGDRPQGSYNNNRPQGDRPQGSYNNNRPQGDRPQGGYNNNRPQGDRPQGGYNNNRPQGGFNKDKDSDDRPQNRFSKKEKPVDKDKKIEVLPSKPFARQAVPVKKELDKKEKTKKYVDGPSAGKLMLEKKTQNKHKKDNTKKVEKETKIMEQYGKAGDGIFVIESTIVVATLAKLLDIPASDIIMDLIKMGIMANINQEIKFETAEKIAEKYEVILTLKEEEAEEADIIIEEDDEKDLVHRAPIVAVMGHVDHGKTTLLDTIRSTDVTESEAGGITQHIGASEVYIDGKKIVFLDTPGHEAFTEMRARGAQVTDIAIIVIAADDGIMPQTIEAINHVKAAKVPLIIAINKIDKPTANIDKVRQELSDKGVLVEAWGGDTIDVPLSAKAGTNVDSLLEMILLLAEVEDFKANPNRKAVGTVIEANLDKGKGSTATMIVLNGTLKVGDPIVVGSSFGKVRAMLNTKGKKILKAGPATAIEITGLNEVPEAGDQFVVVDNEKDARALGEKRKVKKREDYMKSTSKIHLEDLFTQMQSGEVKELNLIVKADVQGSVEAVKGSLEKISNEEVLVRAIHGGVGAITESDIMLASASNAIIIGFNVRPTQGAVSLAEKEKVDMKLYRIIYEAIEDIEKAMKGMLAPTFKEELLGTAEIRVPMRVPSAGIMIAGSYVLSGKIVRNAKVRLVRDGIVVYEGAIDSLRRFKDDVKEVASGYECGIGLVNFNDIKEGDIIENFVMKEIKRD